MDDKLRLAASDFRVRWQAQRDTALTPVAIMWPAAKPPASLRSAGVLHKARMLSMPWVPESLPMLARLVGDCAEEACRVHLAHAFSPPAQVHAALFGRAGVLQRDGHPPVSLAREQARRVARGDDPVGDRRLH